MAFGNLRKRMSILDELGLDAEDLSWEDLASCRSMETDFFFEYYENDKTHAAQVDELCLACPVIAECYEFGSTNKRWGVWGGVYLTDGEIDAKLNKHKAENDWNVWRKRVNPSLGS
jgi:hypothetical protein